VVLLLSYFLRYNPNLQQAAQQHSYLLTFPDCPFEHETCAQFCYLFKGGCDFPSRVFAYEPYLLNYGEVIGEGSDASKPLFFPLLRVSIAMRLGGKEIVYAQIDISVATWYVGSRQQTKQTDTCLMFWDGSGYTAQPIARSYLIRWSTRLEWEYTPNAAKATTGLLT